MLDKFVEYAVTFERAYESRDFSVLEPCFTQDATYATHAPGLPDQRSEGRAAVLDHMAWMTEEFDRKFNSRQLLRVAGPEAIDDYVELHGIAVYTLATGERCHLALTEQAYFSDGKINRLVDRLSLGAAHEMQWFVETYPERFPASLIGGTA